MLTPKEDGLLEVNKQYQEAIKLVINLVTASLVLPIVFLKDILGVHETEMRGRISAMAYWSWGLLSVSLLASVVFYWCTTKYTKALYQLYEGPPTLKTVEHWRDFAAWIATPTAFVGLFLLLIFILKALFAHTSSNDN
jgi:hypothetical protein